MKLILRVFGLLLILAMCGAAWIAYEVYELDQSPLGVEGHVNVPSGAGARAVVRGLVDDGRLPEDWRWQVWLRVAPVPGCLQAGEHIADPSLAPGPFLRSLCGPTERQSVRLTVPEGWNIWQVAERIEELGVGTSEEVVRAALEPSTVCDTPFETLEGVLFPNTYDFDVDTTPDEVLARLCEEFFTVWEEVRVENADGLDAVLERYDLTAWDLVVLASLVEKEAQVAEERPRIAQVFLNRIEEGMKLQTDPTCVYGADTWMEVPRPEHCRDPESTYSTYVIDGLPPTPIASPGRASLEAVVAPSGENNLRFFVAMQDGTGRHAFAATYEEHRMNVERYLR